ncbi:unnamed protein product [Musa acuminata subsp. malaccensis]|uniref:(wild Malaysian banana) hypothetical protein n=1 Tax=Musa acuminata subsp. malaccensis TaxID=214687 RepID=A0A8D7B2M8_MUSAM|nr:unnamed protein product [Musa acuminata subsp. malaccensis]
MNKVRNIVPYWCFDLGSVWYGTVYRAIPPGAPSGTPDFSPLNPPKIPGKKKKLG